MGFEENEISKNSKGGTELSKRILASKIDPKLLEDFQIIPSRLRTLDPEKIRVYYLHDLPEDPELAHLKDINSRNKFHSIVFVSNWQMNEFCNKLSIPYDAKIDVIENPVLPLNLIEKPTDKINLIYFSTPHRGLEILVPVFEELAKKYPNIHLNVHSSFEIYGWKEMDEKFGPLYDHIKAHPQMTYHGFTEQDELRKSIENSHILAYPNIWKETSCRVLIESMSAGLMCVHPNHAALADTSGGLTAMYQFHENMNDHANMFYQALENAINNVTEPVAQKYLRFVKAYADTRFNVDKIALQWTYLLNSLKDKYPDIASRKPPVNTFVYKT